jgi:hypothetical protein
MSGDFKIIWLDRECEPKCQPNPDYPDGKDVDASDGAKKTCKCTLPYPAKRCGIYIVKCQICGIHVAITTVGRPDDPRSAIIPCKLKGKAQ